MFLRVFLPTYVFRDLPSGTLEIVVILLETNFSLCRNAVTTCPNLSGDRTFDKIIIIITNNNDNNNDNINDNL